MFSISRIVLAVLLLATAAWADAIVVTFDVEMTTRRDSTPSGASDAAVALDFSVPVTFDTANALILPTSTGSVAVQIDPTVIQSPLRNFASLGLDFNHVQLDSAFGHALGADVVPQYFITEFLFGSQYTLLPSDHWAYLFDLQFSGEPNLASPSTFDVNEFLKILRSEKSRHVLFTAQETANHSTSGVFVSGVEYVGTASIESILHEDGESVPEPATFILLATAVLGALVTRIGCRRCNAA